MCLSVPVLISCSAEKEVPTDVVSKEGIPENLKVGDRIRIVYSGEIQETYPAGLVSVYAIYMASEVESWRYGL